MGTKPGNKSHKAPAQRAQQTVNQAASKPDGRHMGRFVKLWGDYFGPGDLKDWQRLCHDLGVSGDLASKNKCKKVCRVAHLGDPRIEAQLSLVGLERDLGQHMRLPRDAK